jgi:hypothetical protein
MGIVPRRMNGRSERIRTSGPYVPNVVLYQAELHSDRIDPGPGTSRAAFKRGLLIAVGRGLCKPGLALFATFWRSINF